MAYLKEQDIQKTEGTGVVSMAVSAPVPTNSFYRLHSVTCKFSSAPTTSEDFTVTLDANAGGQYDVLLYTLDPSAASTTDILWQPDQPLYLEGGDAVDVAYNNTDARTWGVQITMESV